MAHSVLHAELLKVCPQTANLRFRDSYSSGDCYSDNRISFLLLQANAAYADAFGEKEGLALPPARHAAFLVRQRHQARQARPTHVVA
jgi:hypothetical protein